MMKKLLPLLLFGIFAGLLSITDEVNDPVNSTKINSDSYEDGLLKNENVTISTLYNIQAELNTEENYLFVSEDAEWTNNSEYSTNEIQLHLYANGYKSNNTLFANRNSIPKESLTEFEIDSVSVNGRDAQLTYLRPESTKFIDSTVAKIILENEIGKGESVKLHFDYKLKIPRSINGLGYATGQNFYFISEWFPKIAVYKEGRWICQSFHPNSNFYSDYSNYDVTIKIPSQYEVSGTGTQKSKLLVEENLAVYNFQQSAVNDFAWFASDEILRYAQPFKRSDGTEIEIVLYLQPERVGYYERYLKAIQNSLNFFEKNIGNYPYQSLTMLDVPRTSASEEIVKPNFFTVRADLFSPEDGRELELLTVRGFSNLFFNSLLSGNAVVEAWMGEGIAYYFAEKIMAEYYDERNISFRLAKYFPIYGLNFLTHYEIPIIYTLGTYKYKEDSESLEKYLASPYIGAIADTAYNLPGYKSYEVNTIYKPHLMLLSLERYIGKEKLFEIFSQYYVKYKFKHPSKNELRLLIKENVDEDISWFFENILEKHYTFDYRVNSIEKISDNKYEIFVERRGEGYFKSEVVLYTENDTLKTIWDGKERWKKFIFTTNEEVLAAEIDPGRKNVLDTNYANNSYTVSGRYIASFSLAMRVFFWIQNALLILGSIG